MHTWNYDYYRQHEEFETDKGRYFGVETVKSFSSTSDAVSKTANKFPS